MFPYFDPPVWTLGPIQIHAFGVLAVIAILTGNWMIVRRARARSFDSALAAHATFWMVVAGFMGAHLFKLLYLPGIAGQLRENPLLLVQVFSGIASFGGIVGGVLGAAVHLRLRGAAPADRWRYFDLVAYAFPFAWAIARLGCALAHDHPGIRTESWLAVQYPGGPRYDLGLLEALFCTCMAILFAALDRRKWPAGFYLGLFLLLYGPFRSTLDALHESAPRYFGLPLDQYGALASTLAGGTILLALFVRSRRLAGNPR